MRRTLTLAAAAAAAVGVLVPPIAAAQPAEPSGLAPGTYDLRLPGAGSVVLEVVDDGRLDALVVPAAVELTLTAAGELVVGDLLRPVPPDAEPGS